MKPLNIKLLMLIELICFGTVALVNVAYYKVPLIRSYIEAMVEFERANIMLEEGIHKYIRVINDV